MKPQLFIGSSVEGLPIAEAIQENLKYTADTTLWSQGFFDLTKDTLSSLSDNIKNYDFAIFVLSDDDITKIRDIEHPVARDNVIFELGLFIGGIGKEYNFFVIPTNVDLHLPTDLLGIIPATYSSGSHNGNLISSLGTASSSIKRAIEHMTKTQLNLSGKWKLNWTVDSENYDLKNESTIELVQTNNRIKYTLKDAHEITYEVNGEILGGNYIQGTWGDPSIAGTYFGTFQVYINPTRKKLIGKWLGFKSNNKIDCNEFTLTKI